MKLVTSSTRIHADEHALKHGKNPRKSAAISGGEALGAGEVLGGGGIS